MILKIRQWKQTAVGLKRLKKVLLLIAFSGKVVCFGELQVTENLALNVDYL